MSLAEYRRKRHFNETPEPAGGAGRKKTGAKTKALRFVVQKHDAKRLHYDFRLELDGVLKSWAVPKGPSYDPKEKRLAVEVEDHPLEYADFEGTIPEGEYGGGTVAVWDIGTWQPEGDPHEGYREGKLKFHVDGHKLKGRWTLVRMRRRPGERANNWLLIKERDETARTLEEYDVTAAEPASAVSGRTLEEIASDNDRVWHSSRPEKKGGQKGSSRSQTSQQATTSPGRGKQRRHGKLPGRSATMPKVVRLQFATLGKGPPNGAQWLHEIKFDGYRILCRIDRGKSQLITRGDQDWTDRMPTIAAAASRLPVEEAILDGELVALEPSGVSSFQKLQNAFSEKRARELIYYAFDILYLDGHDLREVTLEERKAILANLLDHNSSVGPIRYTEHVDGHGEQCFIEACRMGLEGIISKRRNRPYVGGRSYDWIKSKGVRREEFVIGGFTDPEGERKGLGALLIGYHDGAGRLNYAGKVGTGFSDKVLADLRKRLEQSEQKESPFTNLKVRPRKTRWVKPDLVCQVEFSGWTGDERLRHPSFQGLREDKPAESVEREEPKEIGGTATKSAGTASNHVATRSSGRHSAKSKSAKGRGDVDQGTVAGVRLTNPGRVLYPERGVTKLALASFYAQIADWMLPHVAGRPLSLLRCPEGRDKTCFFQKHLGPGTPDVLERIEILEKGKPAEYAVLRDVAGLVALVQMGVLEIHLWGCLADDVERPDRLVFDLDPAPDRDWHAVVEAAHRVRDTLRDLGLESFVKTSGGKGLHVVAPIQRRRDWPEVKAFSKSVAAKIADESPDRYTINPLKARRVGRVFIDYLRNERGATAVAAYSTRAREGAPVSVPVDWRELGRITADHFNIENVATRLAKLKHDPWGNLLKVRQSITAGAMKAVRR